MFFALTKGDLSLSRFHRALPIFMVLSFFCFIFLYAVTITIKHQLQEAERSDVQARLQYYLQRTTLFSHNFDILEHNRNVIFLQGLSFIRLVKGEEQVLFTENDTTNMDFEGVASVDTHASGVWVSLENPEKQGDWTIVSEKYDNGVIVQAGKEHGDIRKIYSKIVSISFFAAFFSLPVILLLALRSVKEGVIPIRKAREEISTILSEQNSSSLLPDCRGELGRFYKQINGLLLQNRKLIHEMQLSLDNVAHDLRTPMTRLRSVAEYGLQADTDPKRLSESLSDCLEESERVLSMLNIMMSVAEAESGTMPLQKETFDVAKSIESVLSLYEYIAEEKDIAVLADLEPDLTYYGDRTRITQVWANLLDNGLKYGTSGGYVRIKAREMEGKVSVVFQDNGMGISGSEIGRIWERLYRGDRSRSQQGLGLGLNYVRAVVEAHGGEVSVISELGEGTCFEVQLLS